MTSVKNEYLDLFTARFGDVIGLDYFDRISKCRLGEYKDVIDTFRLRREWVNKYSWAIPTQESLDTVAKYSPIVEMGAGTGYWTFLLRQMGVDVVAYDAIPPALNSKLSGFHQDTECWTEVLQGEPNVLQKHSDRTLFLCWPPYDTDMGLNCLQNYNGSIVVYVGENGGGCNGCDDFHALLHSDFDLIETVEIPQWEGIHDCLFVYKRI